VLNKLSGLRHSRAICPRARANLGDNLLSVGKNYPRSMLLPNLNSVALSVCEILRGSLAFDLWGHNTYQWCGSSWSIRLHSLNFVPEIWPIFITLLGCVVTLTPECLTLKSLWKSHVTWGTSLPILVVLNLYIFDIGWIIIIMKSTNKGWVRENCVWQYYHQMFIISVTMGPCGMVIYMMP